ncbi:MAG: hypothetical protein JNJ82_02965 [Opitutaceae bacterium]|nr:hypothetical protein [Opitutaceae bacterium]
MRLPLPAWPAFAFGCLALMAANAAPPAWEKLPDLPQSTGGAAAGLLDGQVTLIGGATWRDGRKIWLATAQRFDDHARRWTAADLLTEPHAHGLVAVYGGRLLLLGGTTGTRPFAGIWSLGPGGEVQRTEAGLPEAAVISTGAQVGMKLIFAGGTDDVANMRAFTDRAHSFDLASGRLSPLPPYPPGPFGLAAAAALGGELLVFGGAAWDRNADRLTDLADAQAFDPRSVRWRALRPLPVATRGATALALDERWIYVAGGYAAADGFTARAWLYDGRTDTYRDAPSLPVRSVVTLLVAHGQVYCLGGEDRPQHRSAEAHRIALDALRPAR